MKKFNIKNEDIAPSPKLGEGWGEVKRNAFTLAKVLFSPAEQSKRNAFTLAEVFFSPAEQSKRNAFTLAEVFFSPAEQSKRSAFTLAEVLITLGIIGIVAALTMPALISKHQEKTTATRLKKVYTTLSNAYMLAENEHPDILTCSNDNFFEYMKPYLNISKICGYENGCFTQGYSKSLDGNEYVDYNNQSGEFRFILTDGTHIAFMKMATSSKTLGNIKVDIDGFKGNYTVGKDIFLFNIKKHKIVPSGIVDDELYPFESHCKKSSDVRGNGIGCTAWVIYNENMDYLHCDDLSWNGKKTCKDKNNLI